MYQLISLCMIVDNVEGYSSDRDSLLIANGETSDDRFQLYSFIP